MSLLIPNALGAELSSTHAFHLPVYSGWPEDIKHAQPQEGGPLNPPSSLLQMSHGSKTVNIEGQTSFDGGVYSFSQEVQSGTYIVDNYQGSGTVVDEYRGEFAHETLADAMSDPSANHTYFFYRKYWGGELVEVLYPEGHEREGQLYYQYHNYDALLDVAIYEPFFGSDACDVDSEVWHLPVEIDLYFNYDEYNPLDDFADEWDESASSVSFEDATDTVSASINGIPIGMSYSDPGISFSLNISPSEPLDHFLAE
jgi:hypothetical protein